MASKSHTSKNTVDIPAEKYVPGTRFPSLPTLSYFNHKIIQPLTHSLPKKLHGKSFVLIAVSKCWDLIADNVFQGIAYLHRPTKMSS